MIAQVKKKITFSEDLKVYFQVKKVELFVHEKNPSMENNFCMGKNLWNLFVKNKI